jgi:hypothetical protein
MRLVTRLLAGLSDDSRQQSQQQCFVAHEFDNVDIRIRLAKALKKINLEPYFADSEVTSNLLLGKICGKVLSTRAFVADMSSQNPNVYFELGLAIGFNKPILAIIKEGKTVPAILHNFVNFRFTHFSGLEQDLDRQMPIWFTDATVSEALYTSRCHFLNRFCEDRNRLSPGRVYYLLDETNGSTNQSGGDAPTVNPDLNEAMLVALQRFNYELLLLNDVPNIDDFRFCDFCRAARNASFGVVNLSAHSAVSVYLFAGLLLGLGIDFFLLVQTPDENGNETAIPSLMRGFDYVPYKHYAELADQLPMKLEEFLNKQTRPLIDRVLFDLPIEEAERPSGRVLTWSVLKAGADHGRLITDHVQEMLLDGFPRMLVYVYAGPSEEILNSIDEYLRNSHRLDDILREAFSAELSWPQSLDDQSMGEEVLKAFRVKSLAQISKRIGDNLNSAGSGRKIVWLRQKPLQDSNNFHLSLGKYISWIDNTFIPSLTESTYVISQYLIRSGNPKGFATSLAETLSGTYTASRSVIRIANDMQDTRKAETFWQHLLWDEQKCG